MSHVLPLIAHCFETSLQINEPVLLIFIISCHANNEARLPVYQGFGFRLIVPQCRGSSIFIYTKLIFEVLL